MSNTFLGNQVRPTNDEKLHFHVRDNRNSFEMYPTDMLGGNYWGGLNKVLNLNQNLNWEMTQKYYIDYQTDLKAELEVGSVPTCFNGCIGNADSATLSADEKNCLRECYFKRVGAKDDA